MKLLDRYNRISLLTTVVVIIVAGFVYYFTISYILTGQVDKDLLVEENEIFDYVKLNHRLPQVFKSEDLKIVFEPIGGDVVKRSFLDTRFYDAHEQEEETGRTLISSVKVGVQRYRILITESKVETDYLIRFIFGITLGIIFILLLALLIINRLSMRKLWQSFYQILQQIKLFNLADHNGIRPIDTAIDEFHDLNNEVTAMSQRVLKDYQSLKTFTENASHELMTPLAVIVSKLETLMQDGDITEKQGMLISDAYHTVDRLKKLNRSMLLLSRIENKLMPDHEEIDISDFLQSKILEFQELLVNKEISIMDDLSYCKVRVNRDLLNVMVNNLFGNAISHNHTGGKIIIHLSELALSFCNTGSTVALNEQVIFQRFYKSPDSEGTGLGLTLVNQICDNYDFSLTYSFSDNMHCFKVQFSV